MIPILFKFYFFFFATIKVSGFHDDIVMIFVKVHDILKNPVFSMKMKWNEDFIYMCI